MQSSTPMDGYTLEAKASYLLFVIDKDNPNLAVPIGDGFE